MWRFSRNNGITEGFHSVSAAPTGWPVVFLNSIESNSTT